MQLPGGITTTDGRVEKRGRIRDIDGRLEMELWEACAGGGNRVACIDRIIDAAVEFDAERPCAAELATGDRQFIMAQLSCHIANHLFWRSVACSGCDTLYDISIDLNQLPVVPAGTSYPTTTALITAGEVEVRVPNGADQAAVERIDDPMLAITELAQRCIMTPGRTLATETEARDTDLAAIDRALQEIAPQVAASVTSRCPDCGAENETAFDSTEPFFASLANPLTEFHDIAMAYHWSEAEIAALPRARRRAYLALIDGEAAAHR
ncbi:MAG: hypothetical protein GY788_27900 [bacterium]|nr:hypothetical protein [bacterium]